MPKIKSLKELRNVDFKLSSTDLYFSRIKDLHRKKLDMDVYLPSRGCNLQRGIVWTVEQKQELIMSIFYERYIPPVRIMSLIDRESHKITDDILQVIDGKQRLTTFLSFMSNFFPVIIEGGSFYFDDLPGDYRNAIAFYEIKCQVAYEDYDRRFTDDDKIEWFRRINFTGTPQDVEHLKKLQSL